MIGIVDYGTGNLGSLRNALAYLNIPCILSSKPKELSLCRGLILPGVGAFGPAIKKLKSLDLVPFLIEWASEEHPLLGICLGMQVLFSESEEGGLHSGLGIIPGKVTKITNAPRSIHIGWNRVIPENQNRFVKSPAYAYFVHSYAGHPNDSENIIGKTVYGSSFPAMVQSGTVVGVQFHPEKSQEFGLNILKKFTHETI